MELTSRLLENFDQIVIYGAKGWLGRSAVDILFAEDPDLTEHQVLLIGSKSEFAHEASLPLNVYSSDDGLKLITNRALFLNAAYLRREKIVEIGVEEYERKNNQIISFALELVKSGKLKTFINLSSGVASQGTFKNLELVEDPYAKSKITGERLYSEACNLMSVHLINCRIFSMSGRYVNEFNNLALTSFISQAKGESGLISVKSPTTLRSYVDSIDLTQVLFELALTGEDNWIDSGGELISLGDLANVIGNIQGSARADIPQSFEKSPDYFGNYVSFNEIAARLGVELKNINQQVLETMEAFL